MAQRKHQKPDSCIKCKRYLTVSPIFATPNGYICGRCNTDTEPIKIRATAYENLAKTFSFPCINKQFGCDKFTQFNCTSHESMCKFKGYRCPTFTECNEIVQLSNLVKHYQDKHKDLIVSQDFQISQKSNVGTNKLLIFKQKAFILQLLVTKNIDCSLALFYIEKEQDYDACSIEIKSDNGNAFFLFQQKIVKFIPDLLSQDRGVTVRFDTIRETLQSPNFSFKIHLIEQQPKKKESKPATTTTVTKKNNAAEKQTENIEGAAITQPTKDGLLEELECFVCKEYMIPPIFVCKTGHSLCNECKQRIQQCPLCSANYEGTRNIVLEKLTVHLQYPCRNHVYGCNFIDKLINLHKHEKNCMQITCPLYNLDNCRHKGSVHTIYQHWQQIHPQRFFNLNQTIGLNVHVCSLSDLYVVKYDGKLFKITIIHELNPKVQWHVEQIDLTDKNYKYRFIIDFIDKTNQGRILRISGLCDSSTQSSFSDTSITLPDHLLKPFIDKNRLLYFKLDIGKL